MDRWREEATRLKLADKRPFIFPVNCDDYDWAGRSYYQKENEKLSLSKDRVVFIGDSITESWHDRP